jgi:hypothetical protein
VGANADILFPLEGVVSAPSGIIPDQTVAITPSQVTQLQAGQHYFNVHSTNHSGGEIRGQIGALPLLTVARGGTGSSSSSITSSPSGIDCGGDCTEAYPAATIISLTPGTAAAGSDFVGWTGGGCQGLTCTLTLSADTTVTAVYTLQSSSIDFTDDLTYSGAQVGDWLCTTNTSPLVQVPDSMIPLLAYRTALSALSAHGDREGFALCMKAGEAFRSDQKRLLAERVARLPGD